MAKRTRQPKEKPLPTTYEGWLQAEHDDWAGCSHRHDHPPVNPTYQYTIGEAVKFHGYHDCRVEEILDGGMRIHLSYQDRGDHRGVAYDNGRRPRITYWNEVIPLSAITSTAFARERIRAQYIGTSLDSLIMTAYHRGLHDSPDYQRDYVWTLEDKRRLVRSIFNRCDIGKFVLISFPDTEELEVVDGKQRLRAILDFVEGRFTFEGVNWYQLSERDRRSFGDIMIQYCEMDSTMVKKSDILWLFLSINAGGVPQTDEHITKARKLYEEVLEKEKNDGSKGYQPAAVAKTAQD